MTWTCHSDNRLALEITTLIDGNIMTIEQAFNRSIDYYDDWVKNALPNYRDIFETAEDLIPFDEVIPIEVLDLGAGTGLFSKNVYDKYPNARFVLYDLADKMLDVARERFKHNQNQFEFIIGDYRNIQVTKKFDLVISSLSIHHLTHDEKKDLFRSIYKILRNQGLFINVDQIRGDTDYLIDLYWNHWLKQVRKTQQSDQRIQESIDRRTEFDIDATMSEQLQWLKEAGFINVDCVYKNYFVGVFLATKPLTQ
jgi:tRNA (cmo5U34)-methyltransferase